LPVSEPLFAGVDLGTARVKAGVFDTAGRQLALRILPHAGLLTAERGEVVQDAGLWWRAVCKALRGVCSEVDVAAIKAIAVCGQGPTLVTTDARLHPRGPALTWMDKDSAVEEAALLGSLVGHTVDPGHLIAKALHLESVDPDAHRRWYFQAWDYVATRLCGIPHTSAAWFDDELRASGLPRDHFPPYAPPGQVIGTVSEEASDVCGLARGIPVVSGTNDSIASCIGSGLTERGDSVILGGTSGGFVLCWDPVPGVWAPPPNTYPEPPGRRYLGAAISSSGLALDWLASLLGVHDLETLLLPAADVPAGSDGLLLLPYIAGLFLPYATDEHAPLADPSARGVFFGLRAAHGRAHLVRAVLEGVALAIRQVRDMTVAQGGESVATLTVGGQAHSRLWNEIKAAVLGVPVLVPEVIEAGALGAACLAATGSGYQPDMWTAARRMVHVSTRLEPDPVMRERYDRIYNEVFLPLYPRVRDLFPRYNAP
jgi:xylulokinase